MSKRAISAEHRAAMNEIRMGPCRVLAGEYTPALVSDLSNVELDVARTMNENIGSL